MQIQLGSYLIDVIIIYKSNKNIYLKIKDDLKLYITVNHLVSKRKIKELINKNAKSIIRMYESALKQKEYNEKFFYLGRQYVVIFNSLVNKPIISDNQIIFQNAEMLNKFWHDECLKVFSTHLENIKQSFFDLPNITLKIRLMKTRWGVCNRANNTVTLNSELLKKDPTLLDYVIVHELCHFKYPNHSKYFWNEVEKYFPNYKIARKKLKEV